MPRAESREAPPLRPNHPVTGGLLGKTGLVRQRVVGEDRVVSRGAGAVGVLTGGGVLLKGHGQVQVLLSGGVRAGVTLTNNHCQPRKVKGQGQPSRYLQPQSCFYCETTVELWVTGV